MKTNETKSDFDSTVRNNKKTWRHKLCIFNMSCLDVHLVDVVVHLIDLLFKLQVHHVEISLVCVQMSVLPAFSGFSVSSSCRQVKRSLESLFSSKKVKEYDLCLKKDKHNVERTQEEMKGWDKKHPEGKRSTATHTLTQIERVGACDCKITANIMLQN